MIMMLSMSIGVALAGTLINAFTQYYGNTDLTLAFHHTLVYRSDQSHYLTHFLANTKIHINLNLLQNKYSLIGMIGLS